MRYRPDPSPPLYPAAFRLLVLLCVLCCTLFLVQPQASAQTPSGSGPREQPVRPILSCPSVSICCPSGASIGEVVNFSVSRMSGGTPGFRHAFHWTISGGRIVSGQGTQSVSVDTSGLGTGPLVASFEAVGYGLKCATTCSTRMHPPYPSTLSGRVNIQASGYPVRGAHVSVSASDRTTVLNTDAGGRFELAGLAPGWYRLQVRAADFHSQEQMVELTQAARREVNFFLKSLPPPPPTPPTPTPTPQASPSISPRPSPSPAASPVPEPTVAASKVSASPQPARVRQAEQSNLSYIIFILVCILLALGSASLLRDKTPVLLGDRDAEVLDDEVTCSVFAPTEAPPGDCFLVQVFAHLAEQADQLAAKAQESDEAARQRGSKRLDTRIERGQELVFLLNMPGLEVDEPSQSLVWDGEIDSVQFAVTVPDSCKPGNLIGTVTICYKSVPIGHIKFKFKIIGVSAPAVVAPLPQAQHQVLETACAPASAPPEQSFVRYRQAFISYASEDRPEVLKRVQMLRMARIKFFQDLLTLEPGDNWEQMIYKYIDESDVVYLFWSSAARRSAWVEKEIRYALRRKGGQDEAAPEILPVIIEGPPIVPPSDDLKMIHFNDTFMYLIKAEETTRPGGA